jgi:carbon monoxide dehydrogenase subunit G
MKLNGTHKFKASSSEVLNAILDPIILKSCIPGCESLEYLDSSRMQANISTPLPGFKGPFGVVIQIDQPAPNKLTLRVERNGRGGSVSAVSDISINDEADGALLAYDAKADLNGPIAIANNPVGQGITKSSLSAFFKSLDSAISH